jgi:hypothetical protein
MDEPIKVMVNVDHLEMFEPEPNPYLLASDIESLRKTGSASLSIGAGFNKNSGEGIVLSTTSTR